MCIWYRLKPDFKLYHLNELTGGLYLFVLNASIGGKHETEEYFIRNIHTYEWN